MAKTWSATKLRGEMLQVLSTEASERQGAYGLIGASMPSNDLGTLADLSLALMELGKLDAIRGAISVLDGHRDGWLELERAFLWKLYELKALKAIYELDSRAFKKPRSNPRDLAIVALHGLSLRRPESEWCARELRGGLNGGPFGRTSDYALAAYALWLCEKEAGGAPTFEGTMNGVYPEVVEAWADEAQLRERVVRMCDYHLTRTIDTDNSALWLEFEFHPYPLFPVEYIALVSALHREGRDLKPIDHVLLATPLARPPQKATAMQIDNVAPSLKWMSVV